MSEYGGADAGSAPEARELTLGGRLNITDRAIADIVGCSKKVLAVKVFRALRALEGTLGSEGFRVQRMAADG